MQTIDALDTALRSYLNPEQTNHVRRAYYFAEQAHFGQVRRSGEDYVTHPLAVAGRIQTHGTTSVEAPHLGARGLGERELRREVLAGAGCARP